MIIGLTGTLGAGKDEVAEVFMKHGFSSHSCSDVIRNECKKRGIAMTLENLKNLGNKLREENGPDILARVVIERITAGNEKNSLVVSVRNPFEVEALKKQKDFFMIAVDAPIKIRYDRVYSRGREEDNVSFEEFSRIEQQQQKGEHKMKQQLDNVKAMADFTIINDGTLDELKLKVEDLIDYLKEGENGSKKE